MTTLRTAAQQALEALNSIDVGYRSPSGTPLEASFDEGKCEAAITALRAALAQQDEPVQEPVQEPEGLDWRYTARIGYVVKPYTAPPQRKPLTEKEMYAVEEEARKNFRLSQKGPRGQQITYWDGLTPWLIRAVERAHGIKE